MSQLLWWAIFLVPTLVALVWALWQTHPAHTGDTFHSMAAHRRFVRALSPDGRAEHARPPGSGAGDDRSGADPEPGRPARPD